MVQFSSLWMGKEICPGYRLKRLRGKGGFGSVWEAEGPDGRCLALKFLPCGDTMVAAQEIRSIQVVRQLRHPNLIRTDEVWGHRGFVVVTMELADGSLLDLLDAYQSEFGTALVPQDLCQYLTQIGEVLDFLNTRQHWIDGRWVGLQHCDIKPSNLLIYGDKIKLCDFGLSSITTNLMRVHRRNGTLDYAAPEVFQGRLSDWTDQYALAVTYCQLRSGRLPFTDTPRNFQRNYLRPAPDLSMLPEAERPIIARALALAPQDRWPSCGEMVAQLVPLLS